MLNHLKGRKLHRSPKDALAFGVCSGLGHYLQVDISFVRVVAIVLAVLTNLWAAITIYVVLLLVIPIDPAQESVPSHQHPKDVTPEEPKAHHAESKAEHAEKA